MSVYALKPRFQELLRPLVRVLHARGISANQVTLLACALSVASGLMLSLCARHSWLFCWLPLCFLIRMALNAIDGMLAREYGQQSALGGYLNELCDIVSDAVLYLPFAFVLPVGPWGMGVVIFLAALSETSGILGQVHGKGRHYDGPMGKSDRALLFGTLGLWYGLGGSLGSWTTVLVLVVSVLLAFTVWRRVKNGLVPTGF